MEIERDVDEGIAVVGCDSDLAGCDDDDDDTIDSDASQKISGNVGDTIVNLVEAYRGRRRSSYRVVRAKTPLPRIRM